MKSASGALQENLSDFRLCLKYESSGPAECRSNPPPIVCYDKCMSKVVRFTLIILVVVAAGIGGWKFYSQSKNETPSREQSEKPQTIQTSSGKTFTFANPKKSAHYETNTPAHGSILAGVPVNIVLDFNFDLAKPSSISIISDDKEYGTGETTIDSNKLTMRRKLDPQAPDGLYTVNYNACWPDRTCHDGSFQFAIDRTVASTYTDMRGHSEITVRMSDLKFKPENLRISTGTKVTWINDDAAEHYINTDSHPAHTYLRAMNSRLIATGGSYSYTFNDSGAYPYHCSAHADSMIGSILVE